MKTLAQLKGARNISAAKRKTRHIAGRLVSYFLLIGIGIVFIYPILYMLVNSFKNVSDLVNPTVEWIPTGLYLDNYRTAVEVLDYWQSLAMTVALMLFATVFQTVSCALAGYALARHDMPLKKLWLVLMVMSFLTPSSVTLIPKYLMFNTYGMIGNPLSVLLPALLGQGVNSAVFVLIFYQFFAGYPRSFDEAARLDGASGLTIFLKVAVPACVPAIIVSILFSFVWFWNETYVSGLLLGDSMRTLPMKLQSFVEEYNRMQGSGAESRINESLQLAATVLVVTPLMLLYIALQKYFIEGIESAGLTGE